MSTRGPEIQRADAEERRKAIRLTLVVLVVGAALLLVTPPLLLRLERWVMAEPSRMASRLRYLLVGFSTAVSVPALAFALYLWRRGAQIVTSGRFPPPGVAVVRDTPVLEGAAAVRRGRAVQVLAVVMLVPTGFLVWLFWAMGRIIATSGG